LDSQKTLLALEKIAANPDWRNAFVQHVLDFEKEIVAPGFDTREEITGPLVDSVFDDDQIVRKELVDGTLFDVFYRSKIAREFIMSDPAIPDHVWEPQTSRMLVFLAGGATTVVVGGAYFGDHVMLIARKIPASGGTVHAFEPNDDQRGMLMHNARLNGLTNIVPRSEGLWDTGSIKLSLKGYDSFASPEAVAGDAEGGFEAETVADYLAVVGVAQLDLLMLDIEGAEFRALQGARPFLAQPMGQAPNIVFEVHRHYVDWSDGLENTSIVRFLTDLGYHVFALRDFNANQNMSGKLIEVIPVADVFVDGPAHGFNMVAVKDPSIFDGPAFRICRAVSPKLLRHKDPAMHHPLDGL